MTAVPAEASPPGPVVEIVPTRGWVGLNLRDLWTYRELFYFLTWRDVKVRYKQTALGVGWILIQPVLQMIVFTVVFGRIAKLPSQGVPYPLFTLAALLPWTLLSASLPRAGQSLVMNTNLISKIYFPRLIVPLASVLSNVVDFAVSLVVMAGLMAYYGYVPPLAILTIPFFTLLTVVTAVGLGLWLSALDVRYRDIGYTIPFLLQIWLFLSPIAYSSSVVRPSLEWLYALNPVVAIAGGFRWAFLGTPAPSTLVLCEGLAVATALFVGGLFYFRRVERTFADIV